jgi:hypothetical protein
MSAEDKTAFLRGTVSQLIRPGDKVQVYPRKRMTWVCIQHSEKQPESWNDVIDKALKKFGIKAD